MNVENNSKDLEFIDKAVDIALKSKCQDARVGSIIVKNNEVIGFGFNGPPADKESQRRCKNSKEVYNKKVTDKTCCIHAEQRAILDALIKNPEKIKNSKIYFIRVDSNGNKIKAGKPYCTICSKLALEVGIKEFILLNENGICSYNIEEYNSISFQYKE